MARKKKSKKKASKRAARADHHKHPAQGTQPWRGGPHPHPDYGAWHPFATAPGVLSARAGGDAGFVSAALHRPGPFSGVGPRGYARSDQRVLENVCDLLTLHGELDVREVDVHCRDGVIRLEGTVPNRWTRRMIEHVADEVPGVLDVVNELEVA
jgi:hypothetical protein